MTKTCRYPLFIVVLMAFHVSYYRISTLYDHEYYMKANKAQLTIVERKVDCDAFGSCRNIVNFCLYI